MGTNVSQRTLSSWPRTLFVGMSVGAIALAGVTCAQPEEPPAASREPARAEGASTASIGGREETRLRRAREAERLRRARAARREDRARATRGKARRSKPRQLVLRPGSYGPKVEGLQRALERLGYWTGGADGTYGLLTQQAVLAFQGVEELQRDGVAGPQTLGALRQAERPAPRSARGDLIEIDEARGVLFVVRGGETRWAFHTSTGTERAYAHPSGETFLADTPNGRWSIIWAFDGWRDGPLGEMWRPRYFHGDGIAIHGYTSVPAYPASHGCARVSIPAMNFIWERDLAAAGSPVWVY